MSMEMLIEAIGKIDDELIEEYFSYMPKRSIKPYTVLKVMAAAVTLVICVGAAALWIGDSRVPKPGDGSIVAVKESEKPKESQMPQPTKESQVVTDAKTETPIQPTEPVVVISENPVVTENPSVLAENTPAPEDLIPEHNVTNEETAIPDTDDESVEAPPMDTFDYYIAWNQVENQMTPCNIGRELIEAEYYDFIYGNADVAHALSMPPDWEETDPRLQGWMKEVVFRAPVGDGWYWFNTDTIGSMSIGNNCFVTETNRNGIGSYCDLLLLKEEKKPESGSLYISQVQTGALTLEEANTIYQESVFTNGNIQVSHCNGIRMHLVENTNGELYVRFLIDDTLVTIVDKGYGKDYVMNLIENVKKVPVIDWNGNK